MWTARSQVAADTCVILEYGFLDLIHLAFIFQECSHRAVSITM